MDSHEILERAVVEMEAEIERLRAALDEGWGHANHGQMQCGQCEKTYMVLDEALAAVEKGDE